MTKILYDDHSIAHSNKTFSNTPYACLIATAIFEVRIYDFFPTKYAGGVNYRQYGMKVSAVEVIMHYAVVRQQNKLSDAY